MSKSHQYKRLRIMVCTVFFLLPSGIEMWCICIYILFLYLWLISQTPGSQFGSLGNHSLKYRKTRNRPKLTKSAIKSWISSNPYFFLSSVVLVMLSIQKLFKHFILSQNISYNHTFCKIYMYNSRTSWRSRFRKLLVPKKSLRIHST